MRLSLLFFPLVVGAQLLPVRLGDSINLIAPASNADGSVVLFGAAVAPDGAVQKGTNLYLYTPASVRQLTSYAGDSNLLGVTSVAYAGGVAVYAAMPGGAGGAEEVHLLDIARTADRTLAVDKEGCIQPLCLGCYRPCVGPVHLSPDGTKVLYAVSRTQSFFVVNADGTGLTRLPVFLGALAPSPQRVIGRNGVVVFTSSAPSGPTFAAAAMDVYTINLDGTGLKQVTKFGAASFFASNATISADGSVIAFECNFSESGPQLASQIWTVRADGTGLQRLSKGPDSAGSPSISGDGAVVTYLQGGQIAQIVRGTAIGPLTKLSVSAPRFPVISEDGAKVAFALGPQNGEPAAVYWIPVDSARDLRTFHGVYAPRFVNAKGVASVAGYGAPSPGSLISLYGVNLAADELTQASTLPLPTSLNEVSLLVNGQAVPLLASTPWQINAQLPQTVAAGTAAFQVGYAGGVRLPVVSVAVQSSSPENFFYPFTRGQLGYSQAAAFHAGTGVAADMDHPATAGETVEIYGLGLGVTNPIVEAGVASPASPPARSLQTPRLQIGGRDAVVVFAGLAPGFAGVYQVNAIVPAGLSPGVHTVTWRPDAGGGFSAIGVR
jgi:uncharacterized protein (TIGR03437 family)